MVITKLAPDASTLIARHRRHSGAAVPGCNGAGHEGPGEGGS